jgi:hypothetical protein
MIDKIEQLCRLLSSAPVSPRQVADGFGTIVADHGYGSDLVVRPTDSAFSDVRVMRKIQTDEPSFVELAFADPEALSVARLTETFGDYSVVPRLHADESESIAFEVERPHMPYRCTVLAQVQPGPRGLADGTVAGITVRRDATDSEDDASDQASS